MQSVFFAELSVNEKISQYTHSKYIESDKVSVSFKGTYKCTAEPHSTADPEVREVTFKVYSKFKFHKADFVEKDEIYFFFSNYRIPFLIAGSRDTCFFVSAEEQRVAFTEDANLDPDGIELEVQENKPFKLNCTVTGMPKPDVKWFKVKHSSESIESFRNTLCFYIRAGE